MSIDFASIEAKTKLGPKTVPAFFYQPRIDSTNTAAKRRIQAGTTLPFFLVASQQTAGKGRLQRPFVSPADTGIYLTYSFATAFSDLQPGLLTTSTAVAVCQAIEAVFHVKPAIKWVNDLYLRDKKICGILAESVPLDSQTAAVSIGIGINLKTPQHLDPALGQKVGGINAEGSVEALVSQLLLRLPELALTYQDGHCLAYYRTHAYLTDKTVVLRVGSALIAGKVRGIAANGALQLDTSQGLLSFESGEVQKVLF